MCQLKFISNYIKQNTRNKIVFCSCDVDGLRFINIGWEFANIISKNPSNVLDTLREFLSNSTQKSEEINEYLAVENIGIMFEPELRFDVRNFLDSYSKNQCLIIKSDAEISSDILYWLTQSDGVNVNLRGLSYIQI